MTIAATATEVFIAAAVPTTVGSTPGFVDGNNNLANTPPATGALAPPQSPSGAVVTNTGRSNTTTQSYMAASLNILNVGTTPPVGKKFFS